MSVCLSEGVGVNKEESGSANISCSVDYNISYCEYFARCSYVYLCCWVSEISLARSRLQLLEMRRCGCCDPSIYDGYPSIYDGSQQPQRRISNSCSRDRANEILLTQRNKHTHTNKVLLVVLKSLLLLLLLCCNYNNTTTTTITIYDNYYDTINNN